MTIESNRRYFWRSAMARVWYNSPGMRLLASAQYGMRHKYALFSPKVVLSSFMEHFTSGGDASKPPLIITLLHVSYNRPN